MASATRPNRRGDKVAQGGGYGRPLHERNYQPKYVQLIPALAGYASKGNKLFQIQEISATNSV
jgi:hypothetical protein